MPGVCGGVPAAVGSARGQCGWTGRCPAGRVPGEGVCVHMCAVDDPVRLQTQSVLDPGSGRPCHLGCLVQGCPRAGRVPRAGSAPRATVQMSFLEVSGPGMGDQVPLGARSHPRQESRARGSRLGGPTSLSWSGRGQGKCPPRGYSSHQPCVGFFLCGPETLFSQCTPWLNPLHQLSPQHV